MKNNSLNIDDETANTNDTISTNERNVEEKLEEDVFEPSDDIHEKAKNTVS